ncbi:MAG TPA: transcription-repair coupling factor [Membranihabitans sp.]|nr:transcription-repair coupling factor [Membranihabitans sp.]
MENLENFLQHYRHSPVVEDINRRIASSVVEHIGIGSAAGSSKSVLIAATYENQRKHYIVLCGDKEEAAYQFNSLEALLPGKPIHFLPDSFRQPQNFTRIDRNNLLLKTETANQLYSDRQRRHIIVTYPEALIEKLVSPEVLNKNRVDLRIGEEMDAELLMAELVDYGYRHVDFVYEPGEFSIRGGIIDIFTYGNDWPYRVELFDTEIESIRLFDPESQLSRKKVDYISIVPDIQEKVSSEEWASFFTLIRNDTIVWDLNHALFDSRLEKTYELLLDFQKEKVRSEYPADVMSFFENEKYLNPSQLKAELSDFAGFYFEDTFKLEIPLADRIDLNIDPQPSFNKNFTLLIENLRQHHASGYDIFLFTESERQSRRLNSIFHDLEAGLPVQTILSSLHEGFIDHQLKLVCYTDHQIFQRFHQYNLRKGFSKSKALTSRMLRELQPGDFVTHIDHGVGRYSGLEKIEIKGQTQESLRIVYKNNDVLYVSINSLHKITRFTGEEGKQPSLSKLGTDAWNKLKSRTKKQIKDIASELIKLYARRKASKGFACKPDGYLQTELEASFFYEDTPDQEQATIDVKRDMEKESPMDRLICGDVGFGKTEIAVRAAFKAVVNGKQVAILVPTTILALQHYKTFHERLSEFGVSLAYVNRFKTAREKKEIFEDVKEGKVDILIGTHAILNKNMVFKDLGLLVIDEEQKFGVTAKERLRDFKVNVDTLTLTATPIPRTLQFSLMAARDLSILRTAPPNRQAIHTEIRIFNHELIRDSIYHEVDRGGQVFFVHNRVKALQEMKVLLANLCPDIDIAVAHGQMESKQLEDTLVRYINGEFDLLLCTNIIETGLDIPNANTIIINNAHQFGLSDLHQLRGRVGRSNKKAYCYLFSPPLSVLTSEARKRLRTIEEFSDLGSGFEIAMRDLDIRGAGNLLGAEQSGFISEIGYHTYQKILEESIRELKETDFKDLFQEDLHKQKEFVQDVVIETDSDMLIPDSYVNQIRERLSLYTTLDHLKNEEELDTFAADLRDRFGPYGQEVENLFQGLRLRWLGKVLGFERIIVTDKKLRCFFPNDPQSAYYESSVFRDLLTHVNKNPKKLKMKVKQSRSHLILVVDDMSSMKKVISFLKDLEAVISG